MGIAISSQPAHGKEPGTSSRGAYLHLVKAAVVVGLVMALYARVLSNMALDWWSETALSQGMLIPPFAAYIAWMRRHDTFAHPAAGDNRGLFLVALACLVFLLGKLASEFFLMRISFVLLLSALAWTFWSFSRLRTLAFPLLLLATAVPLPALVYNALSAPLQLFASDIAAQIAQVLGVTVHRDGNIIELATTSLGVAEACSGLNSLSALVVSAMLLGYLFCSRLISRILLVVLAVPLSIAVNVLRVAGTAVLADYNDVYAMGFYHSFSGWLIFLVGFGLLYVFASAVQWIFERGR